MFYTRTAQICLTVAALAFLIIGIGHLLLPLEMVNPMDIQLWSINAYNEIRANYGGMHSFMGLFFLSGALMPKFRAAALGTLAVFTSGLVFGRMVALIIDGSPGRLIWLLLAGELILAATAWFLLWRGGVLAMIRNQTN